MKILFIAESVTFAHIVRSLVLAEGLQQMGHQVLLATGALPSILKEHVAVPRIATAPVPTLEIPCTSPAVFARRILWGLPPFSEQEIRRAVRHDCALVASYRPDCIVADFRVGIPMVSSFTAIPSISLSNAYWQMVSQRSPPFAPTLHLMKILGVRMTDRVVSAAYRSCEKIILSPINAVRKEYGLSLYKTFSDVFLKDSKMVFCDIPLLASTMTESSDAYLGHVSWTPYKDSRKIGKAYQSLVVEKGIYVSLGSSGDLNQLSKIIRALADLTCPVTITTGNLQVELSDVPSHFTIQPFINPEHVLKNAFVAITNGGSPTSYQALSMGVPVLGIVSNLDQILCMSAIASFGAGILHRACATSTAEIKKSILQIATEERFKRQATLLSGEFSRFNAVERLSEYITRTVGHNNTAQMINPEKLENMHGQ